MTGAPILLSALCVGMLKFIVLSLGVRLGNRIQGERLKQGLTLFLALSFGLFELLA